MAGCKNRFARFSLAALTAVGMLIAQAAPLWATGPGADAQDRAAGQALWQKMERQWQAVRADLTRTALETVLTMFLIRASPPPPPPPPPPPKKGPNTPPPSDPPPSDPPPPPPTGQGDPPTIIDPPPTTAPEPAGIALALMGAGLALGYGWRKHRKA